MFGTGNNLFSDLFCLRDTNHLVMESIGIKIKFFIMFKLRLLSLNENPDIIVSHIRKFLWLKALLSNFFETRLKLKRQNFRWWHFFCSFTREFFQKWIHGAINLMNIFNCYAKVGPTKTFFADDFLTCPIKSPIKLIYT